MGGDTTNQGQGLVVAVTGSAGFLGRRLVQRLVSDRRVAQVLALDVHEAEDRPRHERLLHRHLDLTRPTADQDLLTLLRNHEADVLVHLAFLSEPSRQPDFAHELEAIGTLHVLNACAEHRIHKVVMASTTAVYGPAPSNPNFLREGHPLAGLAKSRFVTDRVEAERQLARYKRENPETVCTSLRFAPIVGPTAKNWVTRYLSGIMPLRVLGFDPLVQFVHETDCVDALVTATLRDHDGAFNIVGDGVLPLSKAVRLCGGRTLPVPGTLARAWTKALWSAQIVDMPATFVDFVQYLCVADGTRAREEMGFLPRYSSREALLTCARPVRNGDRT